MLLAAVEAGGTKFVCAASDLKGNIIAQTRVDTRDPDYTLKKSCEFFKGLSTQHGPYSGIGIASFGPVKLDKSSPKCGAIYSTPKKGWSGVNIKKAFEDNLQTEAAIDTDVNCAAIAEGLYGAAKDNKHFCYMTVGTGIGASIIYDGKALPVDAHSEIGHMRVKRHPDDNFQGRCPYHGDCVEGLACGPAIQDRWGIPAHELPQDHPGWMIEAYYIAAICNNLIYTARPKKIILGGGVFQNKSLYQLVRMELKGMMRNYALQATEIDLDEFISEPGLTHCAPGLVGALEIAKTIIPA